MPTPVICQWSGLLARWWSGAFCCGDCECDQTSGQVDGTAAEECRFWSGVTDESTCDVWDMEAGCGIKNEEKSDHSLSLGTKKSEESEENEVGLR